MKKITHKIKVALVAIGMMAVGNVSAQTTITSSASTTRANADGPSIRLIDNKGTIKYLQSNNGITTITSTIAGDKTTTTWQLGGELTDNTYIDVKGNAFALDGIKLITSEIPSKDATSLSSHGTGTGYTMLVRDEVTGETKKLLVATLLKSARTEYIILAGDESVNKKIFTLDFLTKLVKLHVFRNGVKLRATVDYKLSASGINLTLTPSASGSQAWHLYTGDIIEYYYSK